MVAGVRAPLIALLVVATAPFLAGAPTSHAAGLTDELQTALRSSPYVYIASQRKDGTFGTPSEIWFMFEDGAVWVGTRKTSWRARRIRAGRPAATIAVGTRDGPRFEASGSLVRDPSRYAQLFRVFAEKYPGGWAKYEDDFRTGLADGSRVLIRYDPR